MSASSLLNARYGQQAPGVPEAWSPLIDQLLTHRSVRHHLPDPVSDDTLRQLYDLLKFGPTEANTTPARIVFVKSAEAKAKLGPALSEGNFKKTMEAPVVAIVGYEPMMRTTVVRRQGNQFTTTQPWDTVAPRLQGFAEPSRFQF